MHGPRQVIAQSPLPVHATSLPGLTSSVQRPEPVQSTEQSSTQTKSQSPEPAQLRSQSAEQSRAQGSFEGHVHSAPSHTQAPAAQPQAGPTHGGGGGQATPTPSKKPKDISAPRSCMRRANPAGRASSLRAKERP